MGRPLRIGLCQTVYRGVRRHLARPFRFLCFTDDAEGLSSSIEPWPLPSIDLPESYARSTWLKLALFADGLANMEGDCLCLDLDLLILDDVDCFFDYMRGKHCIHPQLAPEASGICQEILRRKLIRLPLAR